LPSAPNIVGNGPGTMTGTIVIALTPQEYFALVRSILSVIILAYVVTLPFKKNYYVPFMLYAALCACFSFETFYANSAQSAQDEFLRSRFISITGPTVQLALLYHFVLNFTTQKMSRFQKCTLTAAYVYALALGVAVAFDERIQFSPGHATATGYTIGPGWFTKYENIPGTPFNYYYLIFTVITLYVLFRYYRSHESTLIKSQVRYLAVGVFLDWFSLVWFSLAELYISKSLPNLQNLIGVAGTAVLLLGLTRHGFHRATPIVESAGPVPEKYRLVQGRLYLARENGPSFEAFAQLVRNGQEGLCVTRNSPEEIRTNYALKTTPIRWLAENKTRDAISPTDLLDISLTIKDFINRAERPVVILQGVEYLIRLNGFSPVLRLIDGIKETNIKKSGIIIITLLQNTLEPKQDSLLIAEGTPFPLPSMI
jgi:hypothetical protein